MQRVLSTVTLVGLLLATAAAFVITEHLKLIKSPIYGTDVTKVFSPVCGCATAKAKIGFTLRHADRLTVTIQNESRQTVATLKTGVHEPKGAVQFFWSPGPSVKSGTFQPQVYLANARRTILLPNKIVVDTIRPQVLAAHVGKSTFAPGDHRTVEIHYTLSEDAHPVLFLHGKQILRGRRTRTHDILKWNGRTGGRTLPTGRYVLGVGAVDLAGNVTPPSGRQQVVVQIRFVSLSRNVFRVGPGARFSVGVATAAKSYAWRLGTEHGSGHGRTLRLRAPAKRGRYRLVVTEQGHTASATVIVRAK